MAAKSAHLAENLSNEDDPTDDQKEENDPNEQNGATDEEQAEPQSEPALPKGKYWDSDLVDKFQDEMEDEIMKLIEPIDNYAEQQDEISKILSKVLDISMDKMEEANRAKYKYFSNCMIFDKRTVYRKHMKFTWEKKYDRMISVKVNSETLHVILLAYAIWYG